MATAALILPGDPLPQLTPLLAGEESAADKPKSLRLGPGLTLSPSTPSTPILPYRYGTLHTSSSSKRSTASITNTPAHYHPSAQDAVLVTLLRSTQDGFVVQLTPYTTPATIPFENYITNNAGTTAAVRKARPNIPIGGTIYARVATVHKHLETIELSVPSTDFGEVLSHKSSAGSAAAANTSQEVANRAEVTPYVLSISQAMVKVLTAEDSLGKHLLSVVSSKIPFEMIVGRNGRVWIDASTQREVIAVVRIFSGYDTQRMWDDPDGGLTRTRELVNKICGR
ncbi:exosome non-catalytic core subunit rrp40 [Orbilia brochopaga]|uniref:Exosome non-catalytic core subunit rrp40 n=1 Tax=Orbilia brochopaga TaxID=3140254 RepID=A0AAV9V427_9PEZI